MFPIIRTIDDVLKVVKDKPEIRVLEGPKGFRKVCYLLTDRHTFDTYTARECRGIVFDRDGKLLSRPLHKFFNIGERPGLESTTISKRSDVSAVFNKIDGSMVSHFWHGNRRWFHTKTSFDNDITRAVEKYVAAHSGVSWFLDQCEANGFTASFEWTSPENRVIVKYGSEPMLRLLHVRDNLTGEYVSNDRHHWFQGIIVSSGYDEDPLDRPFLHGDQSMGTLADTLISLRDVTDIEGCVIQFADGDMVKVKTPWYVLRHKTLSYLREREVATMAVKEELDDLRGMLAELEIDVQGIDEVETRVKDITIAHFTEISKLVSEFSGQDKKSIALRYKDNPYFGPAMAVFSGKKFDFADWYIKNHLKKDFGLKYLVNQSRLRELQG